MLDTHKFSGRSRGCWSRNGLIWVSVHCCK